MTALRPLVLDRRNLLGALVALVLLPTRASHASSETSDDPPAPAVNSPEDLIRKTVDEVFAVLRDPELAKDRQLRMRKLRATVDQAFDWVNMAQSSLGHHWRTASDGERTRFVEIFKELLAQQYMDDIDRFRGTEQVSMRGSEKRDDLVIVRTVLVTSSREQVPMDYTLHLVAGRFWVGDLAIEGVSLVNHYRKTFSRFLVNRSLADLIAQLARKLGRSQ